MVHAISMFHDDSRGVAQPGSATVLGTVGREFESRRPDHTYKGIIDLVSNMVSKNIFG